jgi:membrane protease YdiL (CAAX protease family)
MSTVFDTRVAVPQPTSRREVSVFVAVAFGWSVLCSAIVAASGADFSNLDQAPPWIWAPLMALSWGPALAALLTRSLFRHPAPIGWRLPQPRFLLIALAIPTIYALGSYAITWRTGLASFDASAFTTEAAGALGFAQASPQTAAILYALLLLVGGTLAFSVFALGEDIGYNGFLIPTLASSQGYTRTALLTGLIWSSMHYPQILLLKNFTLGTPPLFALVGLTLSLTALCCVMAWLRLRTNSIWPAVLLHATHNVWFFLLLEPLTSATPIKPYVSGEHGVITIALIGLVAYLCWLRRGALEQAGK